MGKRGKYDEGSEGKVITYEMSAGDRRKLKEVLQGEFRLLKVSVQGIYQGTDCLLRSDRIDVSAADRQRFDARVKELGRQINLSGQKTVQVVDVGEVGEQLVELCPKLAVLAEGDRRDVAEKLVRAGWYPAQPRGW